MASRRRTPSALLALLLPVTAAAAAPQVDATAGAAPGYVDDKTCAVCHSDLYRSYQEVGMARAFFRPRPEKVVEDFTDNRYYHAPSKRHYGMTHRDGRFFFQRYQLDAEGRRINFLRLEVSYVLGSGNHTRSYLFRTPGGELYQLPVAWYSQTRSWGMAPGFDRADHEGVTRRVRRECMFCHNAYPEVEEGSDAPWTAQVYPEDLPEGVGCQRCHGPAAEHLRLALYDRSDGKRLRESITNPARLVPELRDDVCDQCHFQPTVTLPGVRRFGRGDYSYRPGQPLAGFRINVDVEEEGRTRPERFEINHHPYRLRQSRCYEASGRAMSCLTCHDPHRKVPAEERAAHYRAACLGCHQVNACALEEMSGGLPPHLTGVASDDCAACHMQPRRTQDVVHVVMTDHLIRRRPGGGELLAPLPESEPVLVDLELLEPPSEASPLGDRGGDSAALDKAYRAAAVLRVAGSRAALDSLEKTLPEVGPVELDAYLDLAKAQLLHRRFQTAETTLQEILSRDEDNLLALEWLAVVRNQEGRRAEAVELLRGLVERRPLRAEIRFNLGHFLGGTDPAEARRQLRKATELRPNMAPAWFHLGRVYARSRRHEDAAAALIRTLAVDPTHSRAYVELSSVFLALGKKDEALRYLRHGAEVARRPGPLREALRRLMTDEPPESAGGPR